MESQPKEPKIRRIHPASPSKTCDLYEGILESLFENGMILAETHIEAISSHDKCL